MEGLIENIMVIKCISDLPIRNPASSSSANYSPKTNPGIHPRKMSNPSGFVDSATHLPGYPSSQPSKTIYPDVVPPPNVFSTRNPTPNSSSAIPNRNPQNVTTATREPAGIRLPESAKPEKLTITVKLVQPNPVSGLNPSLKGSSKTVYSWINLLLTPKFQTIRQTYVLCPETLVVRSITLV